MKKNVRLGVGLYSDIKHFKNLLVRNHWTNFKITQQKCSFGDLLARLSQSLWCVKKKKKWLGWGGGGRGWGRAIKFIHNLRAVNLAKSLTVSMQICLLRWGYRTIIGLLFVIVTHPRYFSYLFRNLIQTLNTTTSIVYDRISIHMVIVPFIYLFIYFFFFFILFPPIFVFCQNVLKNYCT